MLGISGTELALILFFGFLIFGPEKMPEMGRTVGRFIRQFRSASDKANQKFKEEIYDPFQETIQPIKEDIKQAVDGDAGGYKEDLAAIKSTVDDLSQTMKDPLGLKSEFESLGEEMKDPLGLKGTFNKDDDTEASDEAEDSGVTSEKHTEPVPDSSSYSVAASLYGLDDDKPAENEPADDGKDGE